MKVKTIRHKVTGFVRLHDNLAGPGWELRLTCGHYEDRHSWRDNFLPPETARCYSCEREAKSIARGMT